jgi:hypothetical protein
MDAALLAAVCGRGVEEGSEAGERVADVLGRQAEAC